MKENIETLARLEEIRTEIQINEPRVEVLGKVRELSQSKRWFRDTTPRPDIG